MPASNFVLGGPRAYSRDDATPAWEAFETVVGGLEGGSAVAFASGMAAAAALFGTLKVGASIVLPTDCYTAVAGLAEQGVSRRGWKCVRLPVMDTEAWIEHARSADLIWLESPTNPMLDVANLPRICAAPRKSGSLLAVDNTFATPLNQCPLTMGADAVMHSATKYMGGHSDLLAGVAVARDPALAHELRKARELSGGTPGTLEMFLTLRGLRTMALRVTSSQANAQIIATRLGEHPQVRSIRYPGLSSHPQHKLASTFMRGFGGVVAFEIHGDAAQADVVCASLKIVRHATSLGAVESTIERRAAVPGQEHLPPSLLRMSVGCEDVEDLWHDLEQALGTTRK
ncbi:MAG: PLP-dependent transferase [Phycisphaeraceae bacterium]|nr:PLP-dependent transferase [Phycisphaeraceae bacterium]